MYVARLLHVHQPSAAYATALFPGLLTTNWSRTLQSMLWIQYHRLHRFMHSLHWVGSQGCWEKNGRKPKMRKLVFLRLQIWKSGIKSLLLQVYASFGSFSTYKQCKSRLDFGDRGGIRTEVPEENRRKKKGWVPDWAGRTCGKRVLVYLLFEGRWETAGWYPVNSLQSCQGRQTRMASELHVLALSFSKLLAMLGGELFYRAFLWDADRTAAKDQSAS